MVDTHYDLLTICYCCYLNNDYSKIIKFANEIKSSGVNIIFANLYFMSIDEMNYELGNNYYNDNTNIIDMFKISKSILEKYIKDVDFVYSIEGCDYLNINDLDYLYDEGLRSILLVWNNENKYASGIRGTKGLTKEGEKFLNKAIDLNIGIDLSHTNEKSFYDIVNLIKNNKNDGKEVNCYLSHSNSKTLCNIKRNITDEQISVLKEVDGYVGILSNIHFVNCSEYDDYNKKCDEYLKHIIYMSNILGVDKIMLSTDDMRFYSDIDSNYLYTPIFHYNNLKNEIETELLKHFNKEDTNKILYGNAYNLVKKLKR